MKTLSFLISAIFASSVWAAGISDWVVDTGDFSSRIGLLRQVSPQSLMLQRSDGTLETLPMSNVLRCRLQQPTAAPTPSEASPVDVALNQKVRMNGVEMTVASTNATLTVLNGPDGQQRTVLTSVVRQVLQSSAAKHRRGTLQIQLNNGDRFNGTPQKLDGANLVWSSELLGALNIPLENLARMTRIGNKLKSPVSAPSADTAILTNGDSVRGIMSDLSESTLSLGVSGGTTNAIALDSVQQIDFAQTSATPVRPQHAFVVELTDGSRLTAAAIECDGRQWTIVRLSGAKQELPMSAIRAFEQVGGPAVWLSDLTPSESSNHSFLGREWPPEMNHAVDGGPLRFENQDFEHGIGVHAYSRLTFDLPDGFDRLHLAYAIDGEGAYADVTVRVLLDNKAVVTATHVRAGVLTTPPTISLAGAKRLTLEVDFGDNQDVQDRFNWIEPALLRSSSK